MIRDAINKLPGNHVAYIETHDTFPKFDKPIDVCIQVCMGTAPNSPTTTRQTTNKTNNRS